MRCCGRARSIGTVNDRVAWAAQTVLVGRLRDQAALSGVLNILYELHLPVLSVECLEAE